MMKSCGSWFCMIVVTCSQLHRGGYATLIIRALATLEGVGLKASSNFSLKCLGAKQHLTTLHSESTGMQPWTFRVGQWSSGSDRSSIKFFQLWRLVEVHFVHLSFLLSTALGRVLFGISLNKFSVQLNLFDWKHIETYVWHCHCRNFHHLTFKSIIIITSDHAKVPKKQLFSWGLRPFPTLLGACWRMTACEFERYTL